MVVTLNAKGKTDEINYKGKKVVVSNDGGKIDKFKILLNKVANEHNNTPEGVVKQHLTSEGMAPNDDLTNIISNVNENIETKLHEYQTIITCDERNISIDKQDVRKLAGSLNPIGTSDAMIDSLETQAKTYHLQALRETDPVKESFYKSVSDAASLKADYMCMENRLKPEHEEANSIIKEVKNNDLTQLGKFKRWGNDNLVGVSALVISITSIITTIIICTRKALHNLGKKLGPL